MKRELTKLMLTDSQREQLQPLLEAANGGALFAQVFADGMTVAVINPWQTRQVYEVLTGKPHDGQVISTVQQAVEISNRHVVKQQTGDA